VSIAGKKVFSPLDQQLRLWDKNWSEGLVRQAVWLSGVVTSFQEAAEVLEQVGQVAMSDSSIWRRVERWGERFKARADKERMEASLLPLGHSVGAVRAAPGGQMGVAIDGTMVHIREEGWKELKVGSVFAIEQWPSQDAVTGEWVELGHAVDNSYVAHLGGPLVFGQAVWAEARRRGWEQAKDTVVLGDGAVWIWNLAGEHFYDSYQVVDWYHATEHLGTAAQTLHGEATPQMQRWYTAQETVLFQGHAARIAAELTTAAGEKSAADAEVLQREAGYFLINQRRMQYLDMRTEGFPIGSGMVESGGKQFKARLAGPGMHWSRDGAERLIPIRAAAMSGRFNALWETIYGLPSN
jgi:hypothetical protein